MSFYNFLALLALLAVATPGVVTWTVTYGHHDALNRANEAAGRRRKARADRIEADNHAAELAHAQRVAELADADFDAHVAESLGTGGQMSAPPLSYRHVPLTPLPDLDDDTRARLLAEADRILNDHDTDGDH